MKSILFHCLLFGLLLLSGVAHAEGNCPDGYYPIGGESGQAGPQGCAPIPGYNQQQGQQQASQPPPQWAARWGAIATDGPGGHLGAANGLPSKREAQEAALTNCQAKGGSPCAVEVAFDNECAAMVVGHKEHSSNAAATVDEAIQLGIKTCASAGDTNCHVYYSGCSLPQRIQ